MKVKELIKRLESRNPDAVVKIYNADFNKILPVNCITLRYLSGTETEVELFSDGDDGEET